MTTFNSNSRNTSSSSRSHANAASASSKKWEAAPSTRQTPAQKQNPQNPSRGGSINTPGQKTGSTINPNTNRPQQGGFGGGSDRSTGGTTGTTGGRR